MGIRQTPRTLPTVGMMADGVQSAANATGWLGEGMGLPHVARTLDRLSYGEPLTTGQGMTTQPRPDTMGAIGAVMPLIPPSKLSPLVSGATSMMLQPATLDGVIQSLLEKYMKQ
jgi:hypothetical protein